MSEQRTEKKILNFLWWGSDSLLCSYLGDRAQECTDPQMHAHIHACPVTWERVRERQRAQEEEVDSLTFQVEFLLQCGNVILFSQTHLSKSRRVSWQWTVKELPLHYPLCICLSLSTIPFFFLFSHTRLLSLFTPLTFLTNETWKVGLLCFLPSLRCSVFGGWSLLVKHIKPIWQPQQSN